MPRPRELPVFGSRLQLWAAGNQTKLHNYIDARHKELGPIFYEKLNGTTNIVFVSDPALIKSLFMTLEGKYPLHILPEPWILYEKLYGSKRGLFFMNGEEWLTNRRITNKHLLKDSDDWLENAINTPIQQFISAWKDKCKSTSFMPNLESDFYRLSTDVIIQILLGSKESFNRSKYYEELLNMFSESVKMIFITTTKLSAFPLHLSQQLNLKVWRDFKDCIDLSTALAHKIVKEIIRKRHKSDGLINKLCKENISDDNITKIAADFVIAAGDTTAYTTLWILLLLSRHPKVSNELRSNDKNKIQLVIKETMRLYPVAPFLTRILPKENILGNYILDSGTPIVASIFTSGRDEHNFSQADKFLPYRWDRNDPRRQDLAKHVPSASLPFAMGARSCVGKRIAMLQLTEIIHQIVQNFDLECINSSEVSPIMCQVLIPNQDIQIRVSPRKQ
ncbi:cytochrome P450 315a1, mitochondrial [Amyelois transitella]|uniref:cytochrome P450 315a1, mitochondrial n=1 Tax=Amyelois transitella TaxID=680683 RepID=UPI0029900CDA|nr:cytochrome P450 315a1, mitochondrial [Amyelois transitella]